MSGRDDFLETVRSMVEYWAAEDRVASDRERLEGLAHSLLVALDDTNIAPADWGMLHELLYNHGRWTKAR